MVHPTRKNPVEPLPGLVPWIGGKRMLARRLAAAIDAADHVTYAEPFVGAGGVFFRRRWQPKAEAINDRNGDVANLFRIVQRHPGALVEALTWAISARAEFQRLVKVDPTTLTDIERAARTYYLQQNAYAAKVGGATFSAGVGERRMLDPARAVDRLRRAHARLSRATIECLDFETFIERYDRPTTLFYLDPPYWGSEKVYGRGLFERADFVRLAEQLGGIAGRFILSIGDRPELREMFAAHRIDTVDVVYSAGAKRTTELIISGPGRGRSKRLSTAVRKPADGASTRARRDRRRGL